MAKGNHELPDLPYPYDSLDGISEQVAKWHHDKHHASYVNGRNGVEDQLEAMRESGDFSGIRSVKLSESHNAAGQVNHNVFWDNMGGDGGPATGEIAAQIEKDFGSYENFEKEFKATAGAARGWALLCYDPVDSALHVFMIDFHDHGYVPSPPIMALDVWEHSYYYDYGPDRGSFIDAYFNNLNWENINRGFKAIKAAFEG